MDWKPVSEIGFLKWADLTIRRVEGNSCYAAGTWWTFEGDQAPSSIQFVAGVSGKGWIVK